MLKCGDDPNKKSDHLDKQTISITEIYSLYILIDSPNKKSPRYIPERTA